MDTKALIKFLKADLTAKAMADAFISGADSDRQTAGVKSTLANAFKKISTKKIFMVLSADDVPLNINSPKNPAVISIVNNPKRDGKDRRLQFRQPKIKHDLPSFKKITQKDLEENFYRIHNEIQSIFK